jgi:hypothetical protein
MPRTKTKSTNLEALDQVEEAVNRVITLVRAVFRKFPYKTIHPTLRIFVHHYAGRSARKATKTDEIVLMLSDHYSQSDMLRFPAALLDAPEQVITRWARDQYWSAIEGSKFQARQDARVKVAKARETLEKAQRDFDAATQNLTEVWTAGKKKRSHAESRSGS